MEKLEVHSAVAGQSLITEQQTGNRTDTATMGVLSMAKQPVHGWGGGGALYLQPQSRPQHHLRKHNYQHKVK